MSANAVNDTAPSSPTEANLAGPLIVPLTALGRHSLPWAGGKAANLGELLHAGLPVPAGFCVTTVAYARAAAGAGLGSLLEDLGDVPSSSQERLEELAAQVRERLLDAPIPDDVAQAVRAAIAALGAQAPLAVRSSATAEDLPFASFAGQQDTYLNVAGTDAALDAMRRCWASLWTDRAVSYRAANGIDPRTVQLAVVVQRLVDAAAAGVLFTANPLSGRRGEAVIDASLGLGEAVVAGMINPDHFVVDSKNGTVLERRISDKPLQIRPDAGGGTERVEVAASAALPCLSDGQVHALVGLGRQVERHFGSPQDIEFAVDATGHVWLTQSRPITTLFPLPAGAPSDDDDLRVYFCANVMQGVFGPLTPLGIEAFHLFSFSIVGLLGTSPPKPSGDAPVLAEAAGRLFLDVTGLVRSTQGRRLLAAVFAQVEALSEPLLRQLFDDPRLAPRRLPWRRLFPPITHFLRVTRLPLRVAAALVTPSAARASAWRLQRELVAAGSVPEAASAADRVDRAEWLLLTWPARILPRIAPLLISGLGSFALAERFLDGLASPEERDALRRALPHNPTTEMNLALWELAARARTDPASTTALRTLPAPELSIAYQNGTLPAALQADLSAFLDRYGHRAVAEIDLGLPRWSEDPTHLLQTLMNYLALPESARTPTAQFREAAAVAESTRRSLELRARERGRLRGIAVSFLLRRGRALAGTREVPKFLMVLLFSQVRALLIPVGALLTDAGRLAIPHDIFFLSFDEISEAIAGANLRAVVRERRAGYTAELRRRHVPRLLLSDGTEPRAEAPLTETGNDTLRGAPASAGQARGRARVILEPLGARLAPGEILIAPSTDPGWTPLFLTAGGLVMEMGGAMSHGAVVAREYGIPAVVGVPRATELISDGQEIIVDGAAGTVLLKDGSSAMNKAPRTPLDERPV